MKDLDKHFLTVTLIGGAIIGTGYLLANVSALSGARKGYTG